MIKVTKGIEHIITCTERFDETVIFFRDVMGLAVTEEGLPTIDKQYRRYAQFEMQNGVVLEITEPEEAFRHLCAAPIASITVENISQARKEMESKGVQFVSPVFETG